MSCHFFFDSYFFLFFSARSKIKSHFAPRARSSRAFRKKMVLQITVAKKTIYGLLKKKNWKKAYAVDGDKQFRHHCYQYLQATAAGKEWPTTTRVIAPHDPSKTKPSREAGKILTRSSTFAATIVTRARRASARVKNIHHTLLSLDRS